MYYQPRIREQRAFPVPNDFFKPLELSEERLHELREEASHALQQALVHFNEYRSSRTRYLVDDAAWRIHTEHEGLKECKRQHTHIPTASLSRVFGRVEGNYRDYVRFFHSQAREEYFNVQKRLFNFTADATVLYNVPQSERAQAAGSYEGIKWAAYEPFALRFRMDSCHYESTGTAVDADGNPFGYRIIIPAAFPEVPDLFKSRRTMRMHSKSVMLVLPWGRRSDERSSELFMTMENDFRSNLVPRSFYKRYLMSLNRIASHMEERRNAARSVLTPNQWKHASPSRTSCNVCEKSFSMLRSKHQCDLCGETVCRRCTVAESVAVDVRGVRRTERSKICTPCMQLLREDHVHVLTTPMPVMGGHNPWSKPQLDKYEHDQRLSETSTDVCSQFSASAVTMDEEYDRKLYEEIPEEMPEEVLITSSRSVVMTLDTSDMKPLRCKAAPSMFPDLDRSLQEQEALLRQLQLHASQNRGRAR